MLYGLIKQGMKCTGVFQIHAQTLGTLCVSALLSVHCSLIWRSTCTWRSTTCIHSWISAVIFLIEWISYYVLRRLYLKKIWRVNCFVFFFKFLSCAECSMNVHKRCHSRVPHDCGIDKNKLAQLLGGLGYSPSMLSRGSRSPSITPVRRRRFNQLLFFVASVEVGNSWQSCKDPLRQRGT